MAVLAGLSEVEAVKDNNLLAFAGTWAGDDFEQCLEDVYANRAGVVF